MSVVADRIKQTLDRHYVCYETIPHVTDFTALETSEHTHVPGHEFAKAVIALVDHRDAVMAVIPAPEHVDLDVLRAYLGASAIKLAKEWRIRHWFPDCDPGAIPPFGNLYGMPVFIAPSLCENDRITFNAGSHEMVIQLSTSDYEELVDPIVVRGLSTDRDRP
ncbi:MAG: YbaK/EbsC family protein [Planctomycetes bacterium]|nr:YbaK/EbsC family protein [Planctomycetota bacterium]